MNTENQPDWRILCVDDEPNILSSLRRLLRAKGYTVLLANSGQEGLDLLETEQVDLIISDMRMPEMDGAQFLEKVRQRHPDILRLLLTGYADVKSIIDAINRGEIYRYITKPWDDDDILLILRDALERKALEQEKRRLEELTQRQNEELKALNASLEAKVQARTQDLRAANDKLKANFLTSIKVFSSLIEMRSPKLAGRSRRVADLARKIALKMGLDTREVQAIFVAGLLVDIGKVGFPDELLGTAIHSMDGAELGQFYKHSVRAEQVLMPLEDLQQSAHFLRSQHESVDGTGFPDGLIASAIPLGAKILALASDYDSYQTGGIVNRRLPADEAQRMIVRSANSRYDPAVVNAFVHLHDPNYVEQKAEQDVPVQQLQPNMLLAHDLLSKEGLLLLPADFVLTETMIKRIKLYDASHSKKMSLRIKTSSIPKTELKTETTTDAITDLNADVNANAATA
jgi:response regulator RpfG family c-di-GMP phosphodiesterase